jgi:aminoglycoside phosphotransferase (APT) family kinase protein
MVVDPAQNGTLLPFHSIEHIVPAIGMQMGEGMSVNDPTSRQFLEMLRRDGVVRSDNATLTALTGGVSSEIYRVDDGGDVFVVKRALAKLKVQQDWLADVARNNFEQEYLKYVGQFLPSAVPRVRDCRPEHGYFTMEYLPDDFLNWKQLLLNGRCEPAHAALAGDLLGTIHRRSAGDVDAARLFDTTANFQQLRVEPYLLTTGQQHPELRQLFEAEALRLAGTRECLVHGDFSPKNILIRGDRMVLLDCEVAWYGDPAFDLAFLINHLCLKALHRPVASRALHTMIDTFWTNYRSARGGDGFDEAKTNNRVARLLLMLLLARIDGKSPVEYLDAAEKQFVRGFVTERARLLRRDNLQLQSVAADWFAKLDI